jgi:hypothetical protein
LEWLLLSVGIVKLKVRSPRHAGGLMTRRRRHAYVDDVVGSAFAASTKATTRRRCSGVNESNRTMRGGPQRVRAPSAPARTFVGSFAVADTKTHVLRRTPAAVRGEGRLVGRAIVPSGFVD